MIDFLVYLGTMVGIWGILSLSLNIQYGLTGLVNLGHVAFFMLGAYGSTILVEIFGLPIPVGFAAGILAAACFGMFMALPTASLQQDYWAISTLAMAEIVRLVFLNQTLGSPYVGASFGIGGIDRPLRSWFDTPDAYGWFYLGLVMVLLALVMLLSWWIRRIPFGRALMAIREGDAVPLALGKNVRMLRVKAMCIGGAVGGLAGALFAHYNAYIAPNYFLPLETFLVWAMVILGGAGNIWGAVFGTVIIQAIYNSTRFIDDYLPIEDTLLGSLRMVFIGVMIILVIIYLPNGLFPERRPRYGSRPPADG